MDAQYWGVPQRRKRIFLVADFRGGRAPEILFKRKGLQRDFKACEEARERASAAVEGSTGVSDFAAGFKGQASITGDVAYSESVSPTLQVKQDTHCLCSTLVFDSTQITSKTNGSNPHINAPCHTLAATSSPVLCIAGNTIDRKVKNGGNGKGISEDVAYTLNTVDRHAVMAEQIYSLDRAAFNQGKNAKYDFSVQENTAQTIVARGSGAVANIGRMIVRRLMPVEEARLQGFPDWWCADVPHKDTPEYRMWGNGVALPCVLYVMEGIVECLGNGGGNK